MEGLKRQLDDVSVKVDQILSILNAKHVVVPVEVKQPKKKSDASAIREAVQDIITDIKTAKKAVKKEASDTTEKKVVKKKPAAKKS